MKRFIAILFAALGLGLVSAYAQMTDEQVIEYAQSALESGKNQNQVVRELLARGVTLDQAERIKSKFDTSQAKASSSAAAAADNILVQRKVNGDTYTSSRTIESKKNNDFSNVQEGRNKNASGANDKDRIVNTKKAMTSIRNTNRTPSFSGFGNMLHDGGMMDNLMYEDSLYYVEYQPEEPEIYGQGIFNNPELSFEPNLNVATPESYVLGPGDEIVVEIWGFNETNIHRTISPEGRINIPQVGPIQLSGLTISEASKKLRKVLANKYAGLEGDASSISVTLGNIRTIQVNVMGEVNTPGTYRLSSFSSVFSALYNAGGIDRAGSLRNIKLVRKGREIATTDVYEYLFEGRTDSDIRLEDGDVIIVPSYSKLVSIEGNVKRPMLYELSGNETLGTLIEYAGGFKGDAYKDNVNVIRQTGNEKELYTVNADSFGTYVMEDGDEVSVEASLDRFSNMVEIRGYVFRPGQYQLGNDVATFRQLVNKAGGPTEEAFLNRALVLREKPDLGVETISVDLGGIMDGTAEDILLKKNDVVIISSVHELEDRGTLTINGMVLNPGVFVFTDNTTVEDLILRAGGLLEGASTARVDIARRVDNPKSTNTTDTLGIAYSFPIKDGFAIDGGEDFILKPYDVVSVRMSPGFRTQTFVTLNGAVAFPGEYLLLNKNETIADLIERAGGLTDQAYAKGARITRLNNNDDVFSIIDKVVMKNAKTDTVDVQALDMKSNYFVAVNLEEALASPHSIADVQLLSGDVIYIPEINNTVRVIGEVMFPNAVVYQKGKKLKHYVDAAGGFSSNAKRSKAYIIYANGSAARKGRNIEPGCTVIVPTRPERKGLSLGEVSAITSASSSLVSLVALLANVFM